MISMHVKEPRLAGGADDVLERPHHKRTDMPRCGREITPATTDGLGAPWGLAETRPRKWVDLMGARWAG
jgi:hypothetical protein